MRKKLSALALALVLAAGCTTGKMGPQPFSNRWENERLQEKEQQARRERIGKPLLKSAEDVYGKPRPLYNPSERLGAESNPGGVILRQYKF